MTQEEKQLLFKDLCARLPYGVKCFCKWSKEAPNGTVGCVQGISAFLLDEFDLMDEPEYGCQVSEIKPYLRPMSSMTDEEYEEYEKANDLDTDDSSETLKENMRAKSRVRISKWYHGVDWLNEHHFDYRGLIEKGLALEAPEGMYKEN